jgi:predicted RNA-binding protein YlxR (DUF448 family)
MLAIADTTDLDRGPRAKPGTTRMCVVSRQAKDTDDLIRFVLSPSGEVTPDVRRKLPGRGLWVSLSRQAINDAVKRALFAKSFKQAVTLPADLAARTEELLARSTLEALAMAAKAGDVVSGFAKVEDAVTSGRAVALIHAADGAADGIRKLNAKWAASARQSAQDTDFSAINAFTTDELDLALGRSNVVHAALLSGPATKTFLSRWHTLERFRHPDGDREGKTDQD